MNMSEGRAVVKLIEETVLTEKVNSEQKVKIALIDKDEFSFYLMCSDKLKLSEEFLIRNWDLIKKKCVKTPGKKMSSRDIVWIIKHSNLSEEFIENYLLPIDKNVINYAFNYHRGEDLSEKFIDKYLNEYKDKIFLYGSFTRYLYNHCGGRLSVEFLFKHIDDINPWLYSQDPEAKLEIIENFIENGEKLDWFHISLNMNMNKEFFIKYWDKLYFESLFVKSYAMKLFYSLRSDLKGIVEYGTEYQDIKEKYKKFLERKERFNNDELLVNNSYYYYLKENDKLSMEWFKICKTIRLAEAFIEELLEKGNIIDKNCADNIIKYQDISVELKEKLEKIK